MTYLLNESELRECVSLNKNIIDRIDDAFAMLTSGNVIMPPVLSMAMTDINAEVDIKTAYIPSLDNFAVKVSPGFFDNHKFGLPSVGGLMITLDTKTGMVSGVLLDNGYLTNIRTAAAGGVAAKHLAPKNAQVAGIVGAGVQAKLQLQALLIERDIKKALVWSRDIGQAKDFAQAQSQKLNIELIATDDLESLVANSQVVVTTTPAKKALIKAEWLHENLHITAMGSDSPEKQEIEAEALSKVDLLVVDKIQQSKERGEMRNAKAVDAIELENICAKNTKGRTSDTQTTLCDLTGTGLQDTAIADYALATAKTQGIGTKIATGSSSK